jgi:hypothetical protein
MSKSQIAMLESYGRSFLAAAIALYLAGVTEWQSYLSALVAAFAPVAIRYMNKNDIAFGKNATPESLAKQAVDIAEMVVKQAPKAKTASAPAAPAKKATKAPAKKSTAKKTTSK